MHRSPEYVVKLPLIGCVSGHVQASLGGTPGRVLGVCATAVEPASSRLASSILTDCFRLLVLILFRVDPLVEWNPLRLIPRRACCNGPIDAHVNPIHRVN